MVVYVEVPYHQEGDAKVWDEGLRGDRVDPWVKSVCRVGIDKPKSMKVSTKKGFLRGDVWGKNVIRIFEYWKYRKLGKKRPMDVGGHTWLPHGGKQRNKSRKRGGVCLADRGIM